MIKAEVKVRGGEEVLATEVCGTGEEVYTELVAVLREMMQGGFEAKTLKCALDNALLAQEHRDEWER